MSGKQFFVYDVPGRQAIDYYPNGATPERGVHGKPKFQWSQFDILTTPASPVDSGLRTRRLIFWKWDWS